tara:strand:+ start:746 stop:877 length:132 start_codon:yes stop_codon:yes gene_type:complete
MNNKPIKLPNVEYEMLCERCKKKHKKLEEYLYGLIREDYHNGR